MTAKPISEILITLRVKDDWLLPSLKTAYLTRDFVTLSKLLLPEPTLLCSQLGASGFSQFTAPTHCICTLVDPASQPVLRDESIHFSFVLFYVFVLVFYIFFFSLFSNHIPFKTQGKSIYIRRNFLSQI